MPSTVWESSRVLLRACPEDFFQWNRFRRKPGIVPFKKPVFGGLIHLIFRHFKAANIAYKGILVVDKVGLTIMANVASLPFSSVVNFRRWPQTGLSPFASSNFKGSSLLILIDVWYRFALEYALTYHKSYPTFRKNPNWTTEKQRQQ